MTFLDLMQQRYTTKKYDGSQKLSAEKLEQLQDVLHLSPSSINSQPWLFTFVSDEEQKKSLAQASYFNAQKVLDCDTVVVFSRVDSIAYFEKQIQENLPEGAVGYYNQFLKPGSEADIKAWFDKQVYLALGVFLSACAALEVDATPMEGIENDKYNQILGLDNHHTLVAVAIGVRNPEDANQPHLKPKSRLPKNKVIQTVK